MAFTKVLEDIKRALAIADVGLLYGNNPYDKERYTELRHTCLNLLHTISGHTIEELQVPFPLAINYPTAKVDIRGLVLSDDKKILLVKEMADGRWSLPGGWADIGYSPKEVIIKEIKEETGLEVDVQRLLAVFDKRMHGHPPQPFYVYKMAFYCTPLSTGLNKGFDVLDVGYFDIDDLPLLSEDRILPSQIKLLYQKVVTGDATTYFD